MTLRKLLLFKEIINMVIHYHIIFHIRMINSEDFLRSVKELRDEKKIEIDVEIAQQFLFAFNQTEKFYIDIGRLVEVQAYSRQDYAKRKLIKNFTEKKDYDITLFRPTLKNGNPGGKEKQIIMLTQKCFKELCMTSSNEISEKIEEYWPDLEKIKERCIQAEKETKKVKIVSKKKKIIKEIVKDEKSEDTKEEVISSEVNIFQCPLELENGRTFQIPMSKDGYLHATLLCKASNKRLDNWMRLEQTKRLIRAVENAHSLPSNQIIRVIITGDKHLHGTYIHPDLQVPLAMWISENFAIQVSKWIRELILTGKVELDNEKSNQELDNAWKEKIKELEIKYGQSIEIINQKEIEFKTVQQELQTITDETKEIKDSLAKEQKDRQKLERNHAAIVKKRQYHKFKKGSAFYIWHDPASPDNHKIGISDNITECLKAERRCVPLLYMDYLIYLDRAKFLESCMLEIYRDKLIAPNHEIVDEKSNHLIITVHNLLKLFNYEYTIENELWRYNNEDPPIIEIKEDSDEKEEDEKHSTININITNNITTNFNFTLPLETMEQIDKVVNETKKEFLHNEMKLGKKTITPDVKTLNKLLKENIITDDESENYPCIFPDCEIICKALQTAREHITDVHFGRAFQCPFCPIRSARKSAFRTHVKNIHSKEKEQHKCTYDMCADKKPFASSSTLSQHIRDIHPQTDIVYSCPKCKKDFKRKDGVTRHLKEVRCEKIKKK